MKTLQALFHHGLANAKADQLAVTDALEQYSYSQLAHVRDQLALQLQQLGVKPGDRVGLWLDKSSKAVAAMLAVSAVGAAYVPIDPMNPLARVVTIVNDCDMQVLITTQQKYQHLSKATQLAVKLVVLDSQAELDYPSSVLTWQQIAATDASAFQEVQYQDEQALAYILYTSGSTGVPKGVCISQQNALAFINWSIETLKPNHDDRFSNHAPWHFDLSVLDIYVALAVGASVHLVPEMVSYLPNRLVSFIEQHAISIWYSVPTALVMMLDNEVDFASRAKSLRTIIFAGEAFEIKALKRLRQTFPAVALWNFYGPTETNVCTAYQVPAQVPDVLPIGTGASGAVIRIEDEHGTPVLPGEQGYIVATGPSVFSQYFGMPAREQAAYNTGDIGYQDETGKLIFVGRKDHMVKVKGYRIHLAEVERALYQHPAIKECIVVVGADKSLHAHLTVTEPAPTLLNLKMHCSKWLPKYMLPDHVHIAPALPRNRNGKLSRQALIAQLGL
ncbi:amino acid adenylation domain-containing protein [Pseudoalteromonas fenneropenaei]|uniref:Amino acid adenylation domain-containing protein n=1 Tax=Pseudoalteromonas fenneropenaei TaxID=1737459 RepID=A0ABV7CJJ1_9GAMM